MFSNTSLYIPLISTVILLWHICNLLLNRTNKIGGRGSVQRTRAQRSGGGLGLLCLTCCCSVPAACLPCVGAVGHPPQMQSGALPPPSMLLSLLPSFSSIFLSIRNFHCTASFMCVFLPLPHACSFQPLCRCQRPSLHRQKTHTHTRATDYRGQNEEQNANRGEEGEGERHIGWLQEGVLFLALEWRELIPCCSSGR